MCVCVCMCVILGAHLFFLNQNIMDEMRNERVRRLSPALPDLKSRRRQNQSTENDTETCARTRPFIPSFQKTSYSKAKEIVDALMPS